MRIHTEKTIAIAHLVQTADEDSPCRRLHGHNLKVDVMISGKVKDDGMVVDFRHIKELINQLDHKTMIVGALIVSEEDNMLHINTGYSALALPHTDVVVLSVPVITAEWLAIYFVKEIKKIVDTDDHITVKIFESEKSFVEANEDDI